MQAAESVELVELNHYQNQWRQDEDHRLERQRLIVEHMAKDLPLGTYDRAEVVVEEADLEEACVNPSFDLGDTILVRGLPEDPESEDANWNRPHQNSDEGRQPDERRLQQVKDRAQEIVDELHRGCVFPFYDM
jgi:hypothetical protein